MRSFGAAPARPVIRGLDGDRVVVLEDGQRIGDMSSQSGDHGVPINPAAAQEMEVVRGPATLLYGANAIGGLVNVITDQIPERADHPAFRHLHVRLRQQRRLGGGAGDVHVGNGQLAFHFGGSGQRIGQLLDARGRSGEHPVAHGHRQPRRRLDRRAFLRRRELRLHRHEVRHPHRRRRRHQPRPAPALVQRARRRHGPSRRHPVVSRHPRRPPLRAPRARGQRGRHDVQQRPARRRGAAVAPQGRGLLGSVGGWLLEPPVPGHRRRSARAAGGPEQRGGLPLRRGRMAARHLAIRRPAGSHPLRSGRGTAQSGLHRGVGIVGLLVRPAAAERQLRDCPQPGARGASARPRGALLLRPPPRQLRVSRSATPTSSPNGARRRSCPARARARGSKAR